MQRAGELGGGSILSSANGRSLSSGVSILSPRSWGRKLRCRAGRVGLQRAARLIARVAELTWLLAPRSGVSAGSLQRGGIQGALPEPLTWSTGSRDAGSAPRLGGLHFANDVGFHPKPTSFVSGGVGELGRADDSWIPGPAVMSWRDPWVAQACGCP